MSKIESGQVFFTREGGSVVVLEYRNYAEIVVQHQDSHGHICVVQAKELKTGGIKNPFHPSVYGIGYVGVGGYRISIKGEHQRAYVVWKSMLSRAYCPIYKKAQPTYDDCSVTEVWHNYQTFAEWYDKQPNAYVDGFDLDKDLIVVKNKIYSPDTCSLVPKAVNRLLYYNSKARIRGNLPQGVSKKGKKYQAKIGSGKNEKYLGVRSTPEEAGDLYRKEKTKHVKFVAEQYRDVLHPTVYKNLMELDLV